MPAYTISKQKRSTQQRGNNNPGVGSYQPKIQPALKKSPNIVMGTSPRSKKSSSNSPGPGMYNIKGLTPSKETGVSLKSRPKDIKSFNTPSPNQYYVKKIQPTKQYSFNKTMKTPERDITPSPQQYICKYPTSSNSVTVFGKSLRNTIRKNQNPGVGQYRIKTDSSKQKSPNYHFQKSPRFKFNNPQDKSNVGPGLYNISKSTKLKTAYGIIGKSERHTQFQASTKKQKTTPGVGQYNLNSLSNQKKGPNIIMGTTPRQIHKKSLSPGPGNYNTVSSSVYLEAPPKTAFPHSSRLTISHDFNPGPGQYETFDKNKNHPKNSVFTISPRKLFQEKFKSPGPQKYSPSSKSILDNPTKIVFGTSKKFPEYGNQNPGPGKYTHTYQSTKNSFTFKRSTDKRPQYNSIGPGTYKLKPFIGIYDGYQKQHQDQQILYV